MPTRLSLPDSPSPRPPHRLAWGLRHSLPLHPPTPLPILGQYFDALFQSYGEQHWWPGRSPFEIIVGAILVQNTSWTNAAQAIANLRHASLLTPAAIHAISLPRLARLIRPSGYFRQKARKLKAFLNFLCQNYRGSLKTMFRTPTAQLREQLLQIHGIGPETADSILLYAGNHPVFVVDAYTRRILQRHQLAQGNESYEGVRGLFEQSLPNDPRLFNEYHALIVHVGKHHCRRRAPLCSTCALRPFLPRAVEGSQ
ncbi:MAG TPA: endonuclease III domain-containing protein [Candidatus Eisenbacteria bacterium]|nr:endonuclease III domain-containing protein [Candidatus Eisenbacteria bacterium]